MSSNQELNDFLSPHSSYAGHFTPENLAFNANLQEFAQKISWLSCFSCDKPYLSFAKVKPGKAFNDSLV
jgi:hypothetical protein